MRRVLTYALVYGITGAALGACVAIYTKDVPKKGNVLLDPQEPNHRQPFPPMAETAEVAAPEQVAEGVEGE